MNSKNYYQDQSTSYSRKLIRGKVTATEGVHNFDNMKLSYGSIGANRIDVLRALQKESKFRLAWYIIFSTLAVACIGLDVRNWQTWFNVCDIFVLMINIDLVSRGKVSGIYLGLVECMMYIFISLKSGLYGEIIKMCTINIPLNIFSLASWTKNLKEQKKKKYATEESNSVQIKKLKPIAYAYISLLACVLYVGFYFGLKALGTSALLLSTATLVLTVFTKTLSGLRYKENYLFSLSSGIIQTLMWIEIIITSAKSGSFDFAILPMVLQSLAIVTYDIQGYSMWKAMYRKIAINGGEIFQLRKMNIKKIIKLRHRYQKLFYNEKIDSEKNS